MIKDLFKYVSNIPTTLLKKDSIKGEIDDIYSNIRINLEPSIISLLDISKKKDVKLSDIAFFKGTEIDKNYKTVNNLLKVITVLNSSILNNRSQLDLYVKDMPNTISTKGITTNQALSLNVIDNLRFYTELTGDVIIFISEHYNKVTDSVFASVVSKQKRTLLYDYHRIIVNYSSFNDVLVDLNDMVITNNDMVESVLSDTKVNVVGRLDQTVKGFVGNPIYAIRLWNADREIKAIKLLESKKEYVELLLAELEISNANQYDPELDEAIANAKEVINQYEIKIEKLTK